MLHGKRFFTHTIKVLELKSVSNGMGGTSKQWLPTHSFKGFMDTPSTTAQIQAHQLQKTLDRQLYFPKSALSLIPNNCRLEHGTTQYEQSGEPLDQGGQDRIYCLPLKKVK